MALVQFQNLEIAIKIAINDRRTQTHIEEKSLGVALRRFHFNTIPSLERLIPIIV